MEVPIMKTQKQATEIQAATVARGIDKVTHETFYVVQSDTDANTWYQVRWSNEYLMWCCNCPALCSGCKHNRAVQEVLKIRRQQIALAMGGQTPAIVTTLQAKEDRKLGTMAREVGTFEKAPSGAMVPMR
jgi:TPP-dependent indolepyruvate ferredoxin oxidoreductase alpha subunit